MSALLPTAGLSPSQTVGPFFLDCLLRDDARCNVLVTPQTVGDRVRVEGHVLDGDGVGVPDAVVEIWQANAAGRYNHPADRGTGSLDPGFIGFGRSGTDEKGGFWFETIRPGAVPFVDRDGRLQAPHLCVMVAARGLLNHLTTRLYFADDPAIESDPIMELVPVDRRATLLAKPAVVDGRVCYRWDIVLQGAGETVFFNV